MDKFTVKIHNFKCWDEKTISFENGLTRLRGDSGSGKTTIFDAIFWCLYGGRTSSLNGNKKKTSVSIVTSEFAIVRSKPPEKIEVEIFKGPYNLSGKDAEDWINTTFDDKSIFIASSYLEQGMNHMLITASASDRLELIEKIVYGDYSLNIDTPEFYLETLNKFKEKYNKDMSELTAELSVIKRNIERYKRENPTLFDYGHVSENTLKKLLTDIDKISENISSLYEKERYNESIDDITRQIKKLEHENGKYKLHEIIIEDLTEDNENLSSINDKIIKLKEERVRYQDYQRKLSAIDDLNNLEYNEEYLEKKRDILENNEIYKKISKFIRNIDDMTSVNKFIDEDYTLYMKNIEYKSLLKTIEEDNRDIDKRNNIIKNNYDHSISLYKDYEKRLSLYNKYNDELSLYNLEELKYDEIKPIDDKDNLTVEYLENKEDKLRDKLSELSCPNCKHGLILTRNCLKIGTLTHEERKDINKEISFLKMEMDNRRDIHNKKKVLKEYNILRDKINNIDITEVKKPDELSLIKRKEIKDPPMKNKLSSFDKVKLPIDYVNKGLITIDNEQLHKELTKRVLSFSHINIVDNPEKDIIYYSNKRDSLMKIIKEKEESNKRERIKEQKNKDEQLSYNVRKKQILGLTDKKNSMKYYDTSEITSLQDKLKKNKGKVDIFKNYIKYDELSKDVSNIDDKIEDVIIMLEDIASLTEVIKRVSNEHLLERVETVNNIIADVLETLFVNPIEVTIETSKTLKNGKDKMQINLRIIYNGIEFDSVSSLSGGEKERLSLALLIAFNKISNSNIILLDELLSGLDSNTKEISLECIKKHLDDKTIIHICHEVVDGWYDNIEYL